MSKYKSSMQEYFRTYDNPIDEDTSKTILAYLKFYGYVPIEKSIRYVDRSYKAVFSNGTNMATLRFGRNMAVLIEYEGLVEISPQARIDFIKKEKLEYIGNIRDRSIVYTCDKYRKCYYFSSINYQNMKDCDFYNNNIPAGTMPDKVRDNSDIKPIMMRIVASGEFANEIRCMKENEDVYCGKQIKQIEPKQKYINQKRF